MAKGPQSVGIILDGNRRFAKRLMMKPWKGHEFGAQKIRSLLHWCRDVGVKELTLFAFSLDNFHRPKEEFEFLMNLFAREFTSLQDDPEIYEQKLKIDFIGRLDLFPEKVITPMRVLMEKTKDH